MTSRAARTTVDKMIKVADLSRQGFINGDISTVMSPRTVISWAQNAHIFGDVGYAFRVVVPQQVRRGRAAADRRILSARVRRRTCPKAWSARPASAASARPIDDFRRVLAGAARAHRQGSGGRGRFASESRRRRARPRACHRPARALEPRLVAEARGAADALALRLRHHDPQLHARGRAGGPRGARRVRRARNGAGRGARARGRWAACAAISRS